MRAAKFVIAFVLLVSTSVTSVAAEESNRLGVLTPNLLLIPDDNGRVYSKASFLVSGDQPATITFDVVDMLSLEDGKKQIFPLGSTPHSPGDSVRLGSYSKKYIPNGEDQTISVSFALQNPSQIKKFIVGGIRINLIPGENDNTIKGINAAVATFTFEGGDLTDLQNYQKSLDVQSLSISKIGSAGFLDNIFPDVPGTLSNGLAVAKWTVRNSGEIFLSVKETVSVRPAPMFGEASLATEPVFSSSTEQKLLIPDQKAESETNLVNAVVESDQIVSAMTDWGFYEIQVDAIGLIGGKQYVIATSKEKVLIFPWENVAAACVALIGYLALRRRRMQPHRYQTDPKNP